MYGWVFLSVSTVLALRELLRYMRSHRHQGDLPMTYESTPFPDRSSLVLSQSYASPFASDQPRASSSKDERPATESQSPSYSNNPPVASMPTLPPRPSNSRNQPTKPNSKRVVQEDTSPICMIPEDIENLINKDIVTDVLKKPLSPSTYKDYFDALREVQDFYNEYGPRTGTGGCEFGMDGADNHTNEKTSVTPILELNFLGLPIRPGEKECTYYMRNGLCKYGDNCKFNHPNPTAEGDSDSEWNGHRDVENQIKKGIVPDILKKALSPATYKEYFAALLYAEDFYVEKWCNFKLLNVTLESHEAAIYGKSLKNKNLKKSAAKNKKILLALKTDSAPERRPFLLSGDFVFAQCSGSQAKKFQGIVRRVVKGNVVLVAFEEQFYSQHRPNRQYDISFSFNRVCLKPAHQAISAVASGSLLENFLFPEHATRKNICSSSSLRCVSSNHTLDLNSISAVRQILSFKGHPPYLVEGPLCGSTTLSRTGLVVREAVLQIYRRPPSNCRILICSPLNNTGDILLRSLKSEISESVMFRANAAFREVDGIPSDLLPSCVYDGEWSSFPSLQQLKQFRVIFSTFVSSFRLLEEGITAGHFSHIFLVDASSVTEPESMIALCNLANESTTVILTGAPNNQPSWVRSDIAKKNGLRTSYFERLRATKMYNSSDPTFIMQL